MEDEKRELDVARDDSAAETGISAPNLKTEVVGETGEPVATSETVAPVAGEKIEAKDKKEADESDDKEVSALGEWLELITRAAFWALILYLFFFQVSVVDGPSMQPNFATNDRLVIDKLTYR